MTNIAPLRIPADISRLGQRLIEIRRHLHRYPELSNAEFQTQQFVLDTLGRAGISAAPLGNTGVVATIAGKLPGPTLLLRADMDALPIEEKTELPFRSCHSGVMHACGHDTHTAMLLIAAEVLFTRGLERGTVRLLFQPAEEGGGGAAAMLEAGILNPPVPDGALALHVWTGYRTGEIAVLDGPIMAAVDGFEVIIKGRGVHGAIPENGVDPVAISAVFITAAQQLVSRRVSAHSAAVLSFCAISGGTAFNIIPEEVRIRGTLRSFDSNVREKLKNELGQLVAQLPLSMGATGTIAYFESNGATVNDPGMTRFVRNAAQEIVGSPNVITPLPLMAGEDMGLILEKIPGAMIFIGCASPDTAEVYPHHHPEFIVDENALPIGVALLVAVAERFLSTEMTRIVD